jgi:UDP-perosamine 4-acetyltransferase
VRETVVVLGAGGHAKVALDILSEMDHVEVAGFTSPDGKPDELFGYRCLGTDEVLEELLRSGIRCAFVAVGDNRRRDTCLRALEARGFRLVNAISPGAIVSRRAQLGEGVAIMPGAVVNAGARIGDGAIVNTNATVDHDCLIGRCAHIGPGASLAGCVRVGTGAFLGVGSTVVPNTEIGDWSVIGAGAAVVRSIPAGVVAVGVPAVPRPAKARAGENGAS